MPLSPQGETTSAIVGQVTDATHAATAGAKVTIANHDTGMKRSANTPHSLRPAAKFSPIHWTLQTD